MWKFTPALILALKSPETRAISTISSSFPKAFSTDPPVCVPEAHFPSEKQLKKRHETFFPSYLHAGGVSPCTPLRTHYCASSQMSQQSASGHHVWLSKIFRKPLWFAGIGHSVLENWDRCRWPSGSCAEKSLTTVSPSPPSLPRQGKLAFPLLISLSVGTDFMTCQAEYQYAYGYIYIHGTTQF